MQTVRTMPLSELRARVEEAEKLLRVAKQLARDELADPRQSTRARDRIGSIVSEVQGMFPGLGDPDPTEDVALDPDYADLEHDPSSPLVNPITPGASSPNVSVHDAISLDASAHDAGSLDASASDEGGGAPENHETENHENDDDDTWDLDCDRLRSALANDALMSQIPEAERPRFRAMAERLLEVHERGELYARILTGFEELAEVTRVGAEAVQRQLAAMLTFGGERSLLELEGCAALDPDDPYAALLGAAPPKYKA
jgi:hypothetical protein